MKHTGGNPFFIQTVDKVHKKLKSQFLKSLVDQGLIFFDFEAMRWEWDYEKIRKIEVSEDIVEFLVQNTFQGTVQQNTQEILKLAACIGNREFNTFILSRLVGITPEEVSPTYQLNLTLRLPECYGQR
jgi:predicted ATPase